MIFVKNRKRFSLEQETVDHILWGGVPKIGEDWLSRRYKII